MSVANFPSRSASMPFHVMTKGIGPKCNLDCEYCFYLEKEALFPKNENFRISDETLEAFVKDYIQAQPTDHVSFAWQGGEPTLLGVPFFEKVISLQQKYANGRRIENAFQTNGTLIDDRWAELFAENGFLVGISIDGPDTLHNTYRHKRDGSGSFDKVLQGIKTLQQRKVQWNSLTCVNAVNAKRPLEVYKFLKGIGSHYMQFIPIVERRPNSNDSNIGLELCPPPKGEEENCGSDLMPWSVRPRDYGTFLTTIFDRWIRNDVGKIYVQIIEEGFSKWLGSKQGLCVFSETCGQAVAMEHDGSIYSCDHYVYPEYKLGNVRDTSLASMLDSPVQRKFGQHKRDSLPEQCLSCDYQFACNGGCPKHRFTESRDGEPGLNYLCSAYHRFFRHADPYYRVMAELFRRRQAPANIMRLVKRGRFTPN